MKNLSKRIKWDIIFISILTIALGILFIVLPSHSADIMCLIFGLLLIVFGTVLIVRFFAIERLFGEHLFILGLLTILSGIFCIAYTNSVQGILTILFGLFIVIDSATSIGDSIYLLKAHLKSGIWLLILSILTLALGVVVMFLDFETIMIFAGIALIIEGLRKFIVTLVYSHKIKVAKKEFRKEIYPTDYDVE